LPSNHDKVSRVFIEEFLKSHYADGDMILVEGIAYSDKVDIHKTEGIPDDGKFYHAEGWEPSPNSEKHAKKWNDMILLTCDEILLNENHDHFYESIDFFINHINFNLEFVNEMILKEEVKNEYVCLLSLVTDIIKRKKDKDTDLNMLSVFNEMGASLLKLYDIVTPYGFPLSQDDIKCFVLELTSFLGRQSPTKEDFNRLVLAFSLITRAMITASGLDNRDEFLAERVHFHLQKFSEQRSGQRLFVIAGGAHIRPVKGVRKPNAYKVLKNHSKTIICMPSEFHCSMIPLDSSQIHPIKKCKIPLKSSDNQ